MNNVGLQYANKNKADEFYTKYETIESELLHYTKILKNKIVYCNCDNPKDSNFWKYFSDNFEKLKLKEVWSTFFSETGKSSFTRLFRKGKKVTIEEIPLMGNGDFRSEECLRYLEKADYVITNPPFSLARKLIPLLYQYKKEFLILANQNTITYRDVYPYVVDGNLHFGITIHSGDVEFRLPSHYPLTGNARMDEVGNKFARVTGIRWLTNIDIDRNIPFLDLKSKKWNLTHCGKLSKILQKQYGLTRYPKYDNFDGIEVPLTQCIPSDYHGVVGVPITFLDRFCPKQFKIVGFRKGDDGKDLRINGVAPYFRILVQQIL